MEDIEFVDISRLSKEHLNNIEADCFWCMSRLLDRIQENYTYAQAGIQKMIFKLEELIHRIDGLEAFFFPSSCFPFFVNMNEPLFS